MSALFFIFCLLCVLIWFYRVMAMNDLAELVRNKNGQNIYDPGYNFSFGLTHFDSEKDIEKLFEKARLSEKKYALFFLYSILLLPVTFIWSGILEGFGEELVAVVGTCWEVIFIFIEVIFEKLLHALKDRAYLVLRQCSEYSVLVDSDMPDKNKVAIIKRRRERHDQFLY